MLYCDCFHFLTYWLILDDFLFTNKGFRFMGCLVYTVVIL